MKLFLNLVIISCTLFFNVGFVNATPLSLATKPLYTGTTESPMMMLVMGRDHTLYYEAYNNASDLNGDGILDIKFMPDYDYEGYFDPYKCYAYAGTNEFIPHSIATTDSRICVANTNHWSGNFLNYLTMSRMDVLRKVLYGGTRSADNEGETFLERVFIPQDAHSWGKAYISEAVDGYKISDFTPLDSPLANTQHFFGSVTYIGYGQDPILRVRKNVTVNSVDGGVWDWASTERPVLEATGDDYVVRVKVCVAGLLETNCKRYPKGAGIYKPTGLLHDYGSDDEMLFGLLTGSYEKHLSGGVLRKVMSKFSEEVDADTGIFNNTGIVATINKLRINGFSYVDKFQYMPNWKIKFTTSLVEGQYTDWGNPIGEMLYETMRYYAGEGAPSSTYSATGDIDTSLGLPSWDDPYDGRGTCARPNVLLISDINPSYDSDQLPGVYTQFSSTYNGSILKGDDNGNFDVSTLLGVISTTEDKTSGKFFIGQSGTVNDGAPTVKDITGLASVRGLAPAEPTKKGSYSSVAAAYFGLTNDIHKDKSNAQNVTTMVVALASNLPEIDVEIDGNIVKIVPFAKSVGGGPKKNPINNNKDAFQPTNTIVDWYVESISPTKGVFRINFEDVEQGNDHDMDMIVRYSYEVKSLCYEYSDSTCITKKKGIEISLDSTYAAGSVDQHAGYIISGTTNDGMYLEVKDQNGLDVQYYLDTPVATDFRNRESNNSSANLSYTATRNFFASPDEAAEFLPSPLWYAAKWGGFNDKNNSGTPDALDEWDNNADGNPDTYFPVTNAGELKNQLVAAFDLAYTGSINSSAPVFSSNFLVSGTLVYQSSFEEVNWSGDVDAYKADEDGVFPIIPEWSATEKLDAMTVSERKIFTRRNDSTGTVFEFITPTSLVASTDSFTAAQLTSLLTDVTGTDAEKLAYLQETIAYIRGERSSETNSNYDFRERNGLLGDITSSTPYHVSSNNAHDVEKEVIVFGANDGMVHIVDATSGDELAAYIPSGVYDALGSFVKQSYIHEYSADGGISAYSDNSDPDAIITTVVGRLGLGIQGVYAIDVSDMTTPTASMMKWEINTASTGFEGLGYSISAPTTATLANGDIGVIFSNGYNSSDKDGAIYIANLSDGTLIKKLTVGAKTDPTGLDRANAIAQPAVIDNDGDGIADYIYAGDLFGNMWVMDISNEDPNQWGIKTTDNAPLFTAYSPTIENGSYMPQSITTRPSVARHLNGVGVLVAFGTGKYIERDDTDVDNQATQSFYVIADQLDGSVVSAIRSTTDDNVFTNTAQVEDKLSNLQNQSIVMQNSTNRVLSTNSVGWASVSGFYLDLVNTQDGNSNNYGERQVTNSLLFTNKVSFITLMPSEDSCAAGGSGWYMELDLYTGKTWNTGTPIADDPDTPDVDESLQVPTDSSHQFLEGIGTGMTAVVGTEPVTVINEDGDEEVVSHDLQLNTCVTLSTGKTVCFGDNLTPTGRLSWRHLY